MIAKERKKRLCGWTNYKTGAVCAKQTDYQVTYADGSRETFCTKHYKLIKEWVEGIAAMKERKRK